MNKFAYVFSLAVSVLIGSLGEALAHAHLKSSEPAANATLAASPVKLMLQFSEALEPKFSGAKVVGPAKAEAKLGPAATAADSDATLEVPVTEALSPGKYTVEWHVLSKDGHKMKGSYKFTIKP
jgi:methionine-rich copper-binding protein CopC